MTTVQGSIEVQAFIPKVADLITTAIRQFARYKTIHLIAILLNTILYFGGVVTLVFCSTLGPANANILKIGQINWAFIGEAFGLILWLFTTILFINLGPMHDNMNIAKFNWNALKLLMVVQVVVLFLFLIEEALNTGWMGATLAYCVNGDDTGGIFTGGLYCNTHGYYAWIWVFIGIKIVFWFIIAIADLYSLIVSVLAFTKFFGAFPTGTQKQIQDNNELITAKSASAL